MWVTTDDIKWGEYDVYEGPYYLGHQRYTLPDNPTHEQRLIEAITATEGKTFDAVNMYDSCIVSVGLIQWCERFQLVSKLLDEVVKAAGIEVVMAAINSGLQQSGGTYHKNQYGRYRFFNKNGREVRLKYMREFFLGCSGHQGDWTPEAKEYAKTWCACFANVWKGEKARQAQVAYTARRLMNFIMKDAKKILFSDKSDAMWQGWSGAAKTAFVTFAANNPAIAEAQLKVAVRSSKSEKWSPDWCVHLIKTLVFGPKISIYPARYDKIRPVLERQFGIVLPKKSADLLEFKEGTHGIEALMPVMNGVDNDLVSTEPAVPSKIKEKKPDVTIVEIDDGVEPKHESILPGPPSNDPEADIPTAPRPPRAIVKLRPNPLGYMLDLLWKLIMLIVNAFRRT